MTETLSAEPSRLPRRWDPWRAVLLLLLDMQDGDRIGVVAVRV